MYSLIKKEKNLFFFMVWRKKIFLYGVTLGGLIGQGMQENKPLKPPF